jgi:hypothetical protein
MAMGRKLRHVKDGVVICMAISLSVLMLVIRGVDRSKELVKGFQISPHS